jgi:hypothetical protein
MQRVTRWPTALLAAPIVCALTAAVAGCTKAVDGTALAAEPAIPATSTASPAPRAIPTTVLEGVLLSQDQLIALVGGANMALIGTATSTSDSSKIVDDRTCLGLGSVGDVAIYANSGYVAMRGNQFSTPNAVAADVTQLVTSFTVAGDAQALLQRARQDWQRCAQRRYGFHSSNGNHSYFFTHDLRHRVAHRIVDAPRRRPQIGLLARDGRPGVRHRRGTGLLAQQRHRPGGQQPPGSDRRQDSAIS